MEACIFCQIVAGESSVYMVYEDRLAVAFLSLEQPTPYKVLVVPRAHVETVYDLDDRQAAAIFRATVRIARAVRDVSRCDGLNLVQSNGKAGQQDVFHFHLHLVARFWGDGILLDWDNTPAPQPLLAQYAHHLRSRLEQSV